MVSKVTSRIPDYRWLMAVVFAAVSLAFVQYGLKLNDANSTNRSAFLRWRVQLADLDEGVNVWAKHAHPNTPLMTLILRPFLALPPMVGASLWFFCKALFALASIGGVFWLLDRATSPGVFPWWGKTLAIALSWKPIAGDLTHGNVNLLILFLVVAMLIAAARGRSGWAGTVLGLAIACKLTPALFLFYFAWKRAWTTLSTSIISLLTFTLFVPAMFYGWSENLTYLHSWHRQMIVPYAAGVVTSEHKNQSLPGLLQRMLMDEPSFSDYEGERRITLETHNIASWDRQTVQGIVLAAMAIFALLAVRFFQTGPSSAPPLASSAEFGVVLLGMLLFCERTWKHHGVTLLIPISVLSYVVSSPQFSRRMRWYAGATLAVASLLMLSTSTGVYDSHLESSERLGKLAQVYGAYVWAFLVLLAGMFVVLRVSSRPELSAK